MRQLASIQRISAVEPHPNADLLEIATVLGWKVVVKKGEFKPGDLCVYLEIDSVLPVRPEFEFLRKSCHVKRDWLPGGEGFRLKTIKLRGQLSQGLVIPTTQLSAAYPGLAIVEGKDVTELLNVVKWDPPLPAQLSGLARGLFPAFIRKTDQPRVQTCYDEVARRFDVPFEVSIKLDGSSMTIYATKNARGVCSRNLDLRLDQEGNTFVDMAKRLNAWDRLLERGELAVQGELMGPGIQGNKEKLSSFEFFVFDVWDIERQRYLDSAARRELCEWLQLKHVPILHEGARLADLGLTDVDSIIAFAEGPSLNAECREGLVFKATDGSFSFKAISNAFLLKHGE